METSPSFAITLLPDDTGEHIGARLFMYKCQSPLLETDWKWPHRDKATWWELTDEPREFYDHWRNGASVARFSDKFPYELPLQLGPFTAPFGITRTDNGTILIVKSYEDIFHRLLFLRQEDEGDSRGVVITGQPGTGESLCRSMIRSPPRATTHRHIHFPGKSLFLMFMLVRLISAHQVVLLCGSSEVFLFYCGRVYSRPTASGLGELPRHQHEEYHPIWALVDVDYIGQGPPITNLSNIWPIQASSPNPVLWKAWSKQTNASILGMPRWNTEDLIKGFVFSLFSLPLIRPCHSKGIRC